MQPQNPELLKTLLDEGIEDAVNRQMKNDADSVFAGRMAIRLNWALIRIRELEAQAIQDSWRANPDRMGGQFTDQEIADAERENW